MESKMRKLGRSLKVPIVQELAKEKPRTVPSRYVRPDHDHLTASDDVSSLPQIPIIDMQKLLNSDSIDDDPELHRMHKACVDWGFFLLINHEVEEGVIDKMKLEVGNFFNLPIEEKDEFRQKDEDVEGYGQVFVVSEEQKLDWADRFLVTTLPVYSRKPHLIPSLPPAFRDAIDEYGAKLKDLTMKILNLMAKALGMKEEEMRALFDEGMQMIGMNYYPPCPQPELVNGVSPHSDGVALTILLQVNEMDGLQVRKDGKWIPVSPVPGAFVINIGDVMEIVSNGTYRSIEHRASVNKKKERLSIGTFLNPKMDGDFGPAPSLVSHETPAKFKTIGTSEYFKGFLSKELDGKSNIDRIRIQN